MKDYSDLTGKINQQKGYEVISYEGKKENKHYYNVQFWHTGNIYLCNRTQAIKGTVKDTKALKLESSIKKAANLKKKTRITKIADDQETFDLKGKVCLSLDQSTTSTGYCIHKDGQIIEIGVIQPKNDVLDQRIYEVYNTLRDIIVLKNIRFVSFESIFLGLDIQTFKNLAKLQGVIIYLCILTGSTYTEINIKRWKTYFKIEGLRKEQKAESIRLAEMLTKQKLGEDEADAVLMAVYCMKVVSKEGKE